MTQPISAHKAALRAQIRAARTARNPADIGFITGLHDELATAQVIAGYIAHDREPMITSALLTAVAEKKEVLLPILRSDLDLDWAVWSGGDLVQTGRLLQPESGSLDLIETADLIIVPALAVDQYGNRLGQGGGSYDRALARNPRARTIAVIYDDELLEQIPVEPHDRKVDAVITESRVITF